MYVSQPDGTVSLQKKIFSVLVLQTDLKLYQIFKEKPFYLRKHYKTILKNVKKGYLEHTCHPSKYIAVLSEKK